MCVRILFEKQVFEKQNLMQYEEIGISIQYHITEYLNEAIQLVYIYNIS